MLPTDRTEFDTHVAQLCAGFNVPVGDRGEAYWRGLAKMPLPTFARVVEHALGQDGPEKIPTTHQCWGISKQLRARAPVLEHEPVQAQLPMCDAWERVANTKLFDYLQVQIRLRPAGRYGTARWMGPGKPIEWDAAMQTRTGYLQEAKRAWALEMREGGPAEHDPAYQKRCWHELFELAEQRVSEHIAANQARAAA